MKKIFYLIVLLAMMVIPSKVGATTVDGAFDLISNGETINIPSIDVEYFASRCFTEEYADSQEHCINSDTASLVQAYINDKLEPVREAEPQFTYFVNQCFSKNSCEITITKYSTGSESTVSDTKTLNINYTEVYNNESFNYIKTVTDNIKSEYYLYDLSFLNEINNYLAGADAVFNNLHILKIFPELKHLVEKNPQLGLMVSLFGAGGSFFISGNEGCVYVTYNGVIYGSVQNVNFLMKHIVLISDEVENTIDAAENAALTRIINFINDESKDITLAYDYTEGQEPGPNDDLFSEDREPTVAQEITDFVNTNLNLDNKAEVVGSYTLTIDKNLGEGKGISDSRNIVLVKIPAEKLAGLNFTIQSFDFENNIIMYTGSSSVPLDTRINAENVLNSDYVQNALKDTDELLIAAYDLNLYSTINKSYITSIKEGVEVLIPISDDYDGTTLKIYYITDNGNKGEEYVGTVVTIDGKKYLKFKTNHFSTYAIVKANEKKAINQDQKEEIKNPQTFDNLNQTLTLIVISFIGLISSIVLYKKI